MRQPLVFARKNCIHKRFIYEYKGLHVVFYVLDKKEIDFRTLIWYI